MATEYQFNYLGPGRYQVYSKKLLKNGKTKTSDYLVDIGDECHCDCAGFYYHNKKGEPVKKHCKHIKYILEILLDKNCMTILNDRSNNDWMNTPDTFSELH